LVEIIHEIVLTFFSCDCPLPVLPLSQETMASGSTRKTVLVTGANQGIGLALVKQLCKDHGCHVYLGSRDEDRGLAAVQEVQEHATGSGSNGTVELLVIDVGSDESVQAAAKSLADKGVILNAIVNNAGTFSSHGSNTETILNVNIFGPKRVVDHFAQFLEQSSSSTTRIVNVGSGYAPMYLKIQDEDRQKLLCSPDITWEQIEGLTKNGLLAESSLPGDSQGAYGLSKALLASYTMLLAKRYPNIQSYCISPGYVETALTAAFQGEKKKPEDSTFPITHCLFGDLPKETSGWYFGSDAKRSPLHRSRNPGDPEYDGSLPW
jgi:carbonyl reductase 1